MPRYVVAEEDHHSDSSEEEEDQEEEEQRQQEQDEQDAEEQQQNGEASGRKKLKLSLKQKGGEVCHVCGQSGHAAGFINGGSVYLDCPNKPCYLCKQPGHTTATCPHRIAPDHGCAPAIAKDGDNLLGSLARREHSGRRWQAPLLEQRWQVDAAVLKLLSRRCTCLEFHPTRDNIVLGCDKKGLVSVWDFEKVYERTVHKVHFANIHCVKFLPNSEELICSTSGDGQLRIFDLELGESSNQMKLDLNPDGWVPGVTKLKDWRMTLGLDVNADANFILAGDNAGCVHCIDPRQSKPFAAPQLHKRDKVVSAQLNPADSNLLLTASNDHTARISDLRCLSSRAAPASGAGSSSAAAPDPAQVAAMEHPKVVNSAYFSARSGTKIMTTCIDNRIRVWDNLYHAQRPADREIVHSHDFNRYLTPFRAEWDLKDPFERVAVIGRYISEDFNGAALHPIDLLDASSGRLLSQLTDANLTTICPVNKPHPRLDVIVSGSSRSLYAWRPKAADEELEKERTAAADKRREETGSFRLHGAGGFLYFDADETATTEKKKRKSSNDNGEAPDSNGKKKK